MKAIVCNAFGDLSQLKLAKIDEPTCGPNDVLIEVRFATVSFMDWLMTDGGYQMKPSLPYVPGTDASGVVKAVGKNVIRFTDRLFVMFNNDHRIALIAQVLEGQQQTVIVALMQAD